MLRLPPRGRRRGRSQLSQRFAAWADGDHAKLLRWWEQDRQSARHPTHQRHDEAREVDRAIRLIREGELSKAVHLLTSSGLGDLSDPRVVEQLRGKHPARKAEVPESIDDLGPFRRIHVDLRPTLRGLHRHAGTGVSGFRNEYLIALTEHFSDPRARRVIPLLESFADMYANAELPSWFYDAFTSVKQMAPIKEAASGPNAAPDVRPISIGECLRRAIHTSIAAQNKDAFG